MSNPDKVNQIAGILSGARASRAIIERQQRAEDLADERFADREPGSVSEAEYQSAVAEIAESLR